MVTKTAARIATRAEVPQIENVPCQEEPAGGIVLDADYAEDRPVALLAERQREFQKSLRGQYVDVEMPPA